MTYGKWFWARYDDIGKVLEISAVYDDVLKKNTPFVEYATLLANRICQELELPCKASYGKWGSRLVPKKNPNISMEELELYADIIITHPSWEALKESTRIFTFGNDHSLGNKTEES